MWHKLRQLLELIRFSHTVFALPFALMAAVLAWSVPAASGGNSTTGGGTVGFRACDLLGILICMVCARSAAMAFNRLVDRDLDARNPRTQGRHLPAGLLSVGSVVAFTIVCAAGFVLGTLLFLPNRLPLWLSVPVLAFLFGYSFTKRFSAVSHFWLGAALMLAPLSTWIALRGSVVLADPADLLPAIVLGGVVLSWVAGFDMLYACQDAAFDRQARLHSVPVQMGIDGALRLAAACHLATVLALALLPFTAALGGPPLGLGWIYGLSVVLVAALLAYEHAIVRPDDLSRVNLAFFHVNAVISLGLLLVVVLEVWF